MLFTPPLEKKLLTQTFRLSKTTHELRSLLALYSLCSWNKMKPAKVSVVCFPQESKTIRDLHLNSLLHLTNIYYYITG